MLVLTRKRSEMIQIGENIVVKIIQTGKSSVKIGIEAPNNVRVLRSELEPHTGNEYLLQRLQDRHTRLPEEVTVETTST
ncbi:MAG: carbon storage regulator [Planctomycetales bacterium]